jgi:Flp pilus assembly pilin Flp
MRTWWNVVTDLVGRAASLGDRERERGQTLAEYSLILSFIAVGVILALSALGAVTTGMFWDPINRVFTEVIGMFTP